jgi:ABC-2 type transport system ATP-binding protein
MPIIEADGLTKTYRVFQKKEGILGALRGLYRRDYKEVRAVEGVSFSIEPGEMVAFLGPNGAGKTTTLKMLSGLIYPTSGTASVLGFTPWERLDAFRRQFALVMGQKNQLWWDLPAADSFELHREIYSIPEAEFKKTLAELTELLGVEKLTRQAVRELSLGERMKMELIAALLHQPQLLLLDEPTIGLDVVAQVAIQKCLRDYHARRGVTMLLTSHYMRDVEALCQRVLVITHGRLVYDGPLAGLSERFGNEKLVKLRFAESAPDDAELCRFGEVVRREGPSVDLKVDRNEVAAVLGAVLDSYAVDDVIVQDPPLEQVIARVFEEAKAVHDVA